MGLFGKSKKKKQQQSLLKAKQAKKVQEAAIAKGTAKAQREVEEEKKEEPVVGAAEEEEPAKSGDLLNDTVDTTDTEEGQEKFEDPASSIAIHVESNPSEDVGALEETAIETTTAEETTEEAENPAANTKEIESADFNDDSGWTPFESETFKDWSEGKGAPAVSASASLIIDDLQQEEANKKEENQPPVAGAEDQPPVAEADGQPPVAEAEEKKEGETEEKKEEQKSAFDSNKVLENAKMAASEAAVTFGLAASTAYTMAMACAGDIQAGFTDEIHDSASVGTCGTRDTGTIDSRTVYTNDRDTSGLDTTMDTEYTDGDNTAYTDDASRASKVTFQDMVEEAPRAAAVTQEAADDTPAVAENTANNDPQDDINTDTDAESAALTESNSKADPQAVPEDTAVPDDAELPEDTAVPEDAELPEVTAEAVAKENVQVDSENVPPEVEKIKSSSTEDADGEYYPLADLQTNTIEGIDNSRRERYLSPKDFQATFSMTQEEFAKLPKWKRDGIKKKAELF
jgi:hypothetical protein